MFCLKCGEVIPDGSDTCPKCGVCLTNIDDKQEVVYASQKDEENIEQPSKKKKIPKKILVGIISVLCIITVTLVINEVNKANLKKSIVKEWGYVDGSIIKVLDIEDHEMEYRLETGYKWLDTSLGSYEWKPVCGNKIKVKRFTDEYETFSIELNDNKSMLTISPAITSTDSSETWYHTD